MNPRMSWYENEHKHSLEHEERDPWQDFEPCNHGYFSLESFQQPKKRDDDDVKKGVEEVHENIF